MMALPGLDGVIRKAPMGFERRGNLRRGYCCGYGRRRRGGGLAGLRSPAASVEGSAAFRAVSLGTASPTPAPVSRTTCSVRAASGLLAVWSPTGTPDRSAPFSTSNASPSGLSVSSDGVTAALLIVL